MSSKKGKETTRNAEISREQMELLTTEKELKALLKKINEHNNQLLVEELQLSSAKITEKQLNTESSSQEEPSTSSGTSVNPNDKFDSVALINEQNLDLKSLQGSESNEEFDD